MLHIHIVPAEPEDLSAPQAVDEQQDKCRVQPVTPRGLQEGAGLSRRPRLLADRAIGRQRGEPGDVAGDQLLAHGAGERRSEDGAHDMNLRDRVPGRQATVQPGLHHRHREPVKPVSSQAGPQVEPGDRLVLRVGARPGRLAGNVFQPVVQVLPHLPHVIGTRNAAGRAVLKFDQPDMHLLTSPPVHVSAAKRAVSRQHIGGACPPAIFALPGAALTIGSATGRPSGHLIQQLGHHLGDRISRYPAAATDPERGQLPRTNQLIHFPPADLQTLRDLIDRQIVIIRGFVSVMPPSRLPKDPADRSWQPVAWPR